MALPNGSAGLSVGLILFPNLTQLDLTGPYEVFSRLPKTKVDPRRGDVGARTK